MTEVYSGNQTNRPDASELPREAIHSLTTPLKRFLAIESAASGILLLVTLCALFISNSSLNPFFSEFWETSVGFHFGLFDSTRSLREWINDGLMTLFFLLVSLELKRALVIGELRNPRLAILSIMAAIGGMIVPAALYLLYQLDKPGQSGWGVVMATDTAFVLGCLALAGSRIPSSLRIFMLSLAIIDDIGAILIVAIGYGEQIRWQPLLVASIILFAVRGISLLGIRSIPIYFLFGTVLWGIIDSSGIHPTITGVLLGLLTPTSAWVSNTQLHSVLGRVKEYPDYLHKHTTEERIALQRAHTATREVFSPVEQLELMLHPWVGFIILPLFALANAGVPLTFVHIEYSITIPIFIGFVLGKPLGVLTFSWLTVRTGLGMLPGDLNWPLLTAGGLLAGIGFTMAIFIAELAFSSEFIESAKLGILTASVFSACAGMLFLVVYSVDQDRKIKLTQSKK